VKVGDIVKIRRFKRDPISPDDRLWIIVSKREYSLSTGAPLNRRWKIIHLETGACAGFIPEQRLEVISECLPC
jgi:hypothetical protein